MSQDKTLPGTHILFANATSTGHSQNQYGNGKMDLSLHRPGHQYPWLDLGVIYFSNPTAEQYKAAEEMQRAFPYGELAGNKSDMHRRLSFKQAEYINYLIREMLMDKLNRGGIPADDEVDVIMKEIRENSLPSNRAKVKEERGYIFTDDQNLLLSKLRSAASAKNIVLNIMFESETRGNISFTRPGGNFRINFINVAGQGDGLSDALKAAIYQIERTDNPPKPPFPPNRIETEDYKKFNKG